MAEQFMVSKELPDVETGEKMASSRPLGNEGHSKYRGKVGASVAAQSALIQQATEGELSAWGVSSEEARDELRMEGSEKVGEVIIATVKRRAN